MGGLSQELFRLAAATPEGALVHGRALAYASAEAHASFRRGIDLSASARFEAQANAQIGSEVAAVLSAGVEGSAWLALQAAIPLDLFDPNGGAGLLARFRAQVAIAAYLGASLRLQFDEFRRMLDDNVDGPLERLLDIFLEEAVAEAGVWGRVSFSAEAYGELVVAGSLLPWATGGAGFTLSAQFGAGVGLGAGVQFLANIGFEDPARLLERLADLTAELVLAEGERYLAEGASENALARSALDIARMLVPLASRTVFRLGLKLVQPGPDGAARAAQAIVDSFLRQVQEMVFQTVCELAFRALGDLLEEAGIGNRLAELGPDQRAQLRGVLEAVRDRLVALGDADWLEVDIWLVAVTDVLDAFDRLLATGVLPPEVTEACRGPLATVWSAAALAHRVMSLTRMAAGSRPEEDPFGTSPLSIPTNGSLAAYIATALGHPPDTALTAAHLVAFLIGVDPLAELRRVLPEIAATLDWIAIATGWGFEELIETVLVTLARPDAEQVATLLTSLGAAVAHAVEESVIPVLLDPLRHRDPALRLVIDELVNPALLAVPTVVLPELAHLSDDDAKLRLREALSAVLLQSVGRFVVASGEVLLSHALAASEAFLRQTASSMAAGEQPVALGMIESAAARAGLPAPGGYVVGGLLGISADVVALLRGADDAVVGGARHALELGLGVPDSRRQTFTALVSSDAPPNLGDLQTVLGQVEDATWDVVARVASEVIETLGRMFGDLAASVAEAIDLAGQALVTAALDAVQWLVGVGEELQRVLDDLGRQAAALLASIAQAAELLAADLRARAGAVVESIRAVGRATLEPLVADFPHWARDAILGLYNALFDGVRWLIEVPLRLLESVAVWVQEVLTSRLDVTSHDEFAVRKEVHRRIHESIAGDVHFDLALEAYGVRVFDAGRVTIPAGVVGGAIVGAVSGSEQFNTTVRETADTAVQVQAIRSQQATLEAKRADAAQAVAQGERLVPQQPLGVQFLSPKPKEVVAAPAAVRVVVTGANRTFAEPTLGVPPRLTVIVNGQEWSPPAGSWMETSSGLALTLTLTLDPPSSPAFPDKRVAVFEGGETGLQERLVRLDRLTGTRIMLNDREPVSAAAPVFAALATADTEAAQASIPGSAGVVPTDLSARTRAQLLLAAGGGNGTQPRSAEVRGVGAATTVARSDDPKGSEGGVRPVRGSVLKPGAPEGEGRLSVPARPGANVVQVAVADGQGRKATGTHIVIVQPALTVRVEPASIIPERPVEVTVRAFDARTGREVGDGQGHVIVDGVDVGQLGQPFRHTFVHRASDIEADPEPQPGGQRAPRPVARLSMPKGSVMLLGYAPAPIPFRFSAPVPDHAAQFVAQSVPGRMQASQPYPVSVRMRNTGGLTWEAGSGFRLGSHNPTDNTVWGPVRVELPAAVPPGQEAVFNFTVTAPPRPGVRSFQWRMVQDGVTWFGEPTADVAVEVFLERLTVTVEPPTTVLKREVEVMVRAYDVQTGSEVGTNLGRVSVNGVEVGRTGEPFRHTFQLQRHEERDPEPLPSGRPAPPIITWVNPEGTVEVRGYLPEPIPFVFAEPSPDRAAHFVAQDVPNRMQARQHYAVTVRIRNTGAVTWTADGAFRLGSQSPTDHQAWGMARVELPGPIGTGQEAVFSFTVTAPSSPGLFHFHWRMVQEGVAWFGDATADVTVEVFVPEAAECPDIRRRIAELEQEIGDLEAAIEGTSPVEERVSRRRITAANKEIQELTTRAQNLGCWL